MLFNSWGYLLFLALGVGLHWLLPHRFRIHLLAILSICFYAMWRWDFCLLMVFSAWVDYVASSRIAAAENKRTRKHWLWASLIVNLGLLVFFKYTYFLYANLQAMGGLFGVGMPDLALGILLPLGISFYTFQTISYTIDVYRKVQTPAQSFPAFLTYVTFWPQLIAGPVLRAGEVLPQLISERKFQRSDFFYGLERILWGLFKKVVLADQIAGFVDKAFSAPAQGFTGFDVWVATFLFGFQIYFDFAGYSDVAIGSARMMGIRFPENFNWPYMALSPKDLWQRWHISLSSWIRDYLYLPLTGQRYQTKSLGGIAVAAESGRNRRIGALFLTWFIMGLWHGAGWTFALWGIYHAIFITVYRSVNMLRLLPTRRPAIAWVLMLPISMASWILFRAESLEQALLLYGKLLDPRAYDLGNRLMSGDSYLLAVALVLGMLGIFLIKHLMEKDKWGWWPLAFGRGLAAATAVFLILVYLRPIRQFIYFQF